MSFVTICDIRLNPSTAESIFESEMVHDVMPEAGDLPAPPGTLFTRSLYRAVREEFPPTYRCIVRSVRVSDSRFFAMRPRIHMLGAETTDPRVPSLRGSLPTGEAALDAVRSSLLMVTIHLPFGVGEAAFEKELAAALRGEVGVSTRVNNIDAAFWTHDDTAVPGKTEYLVAAYGSFMEPALRGKTTDQIQAAGGEIMESLLFSHAGTVTGDETSTPEGKC